MYISSYFRFPKFSYICFWNEFFSCLLWNVILIDNWPFSPKVLRAILMNKLKLFGHCILAFMVNIFFNKIGFKFRYSFLKSLTKLKMGCEADLKYYPKILEYSIKFIHSRHKVCTGNGNNIVVQHHSLSIYKVSLSTCQ